MRICKYTRFQITIKCQEKFCVTSGLFIAIIVSKTLHKTNLDRFEENGPLANHITTFENPMVVPIYQLSLGW